MVRGRDRPEASETGLTQAAASKRSRDARPFARNPVASTMPPMERPPRIFISVAEESADLHAAALVRVAQARCPGVRFSGLTGPRLRAAGVQTVFDFASYAAMLTGILSQLGRGARALAAAEDAWQRERPDLVVVMDSSALHLPMAYRARRAGLPVLYYIAPQVWASREYRNRQLAAYVNRVACILPFEQNYFRRRGVPATYVGHPLFEHLRSATPDPQVVQRLRSEITPVVALLPGSRRHVIDTMLPRQLAVVRRLRTNGKPVQLAVSCSSTQRLALVRRHVYAAGFPADVIVDDNASLLAAADLVLVASGTATLHAAYYRKPMIVMYDAGWLLRLPYALFGKYVIKTPHLSLVNLLAGARVVPEFMPFVTNINAVATVARQLLDDETRRRIMVRQLDELVRPLESSTASERVWDLVCEQLGRHRFPATPPAAAVL